MIVNSKQLDNAADEIGEGARKTKEGVLVTAAQLRTAARILREAEPSVCNGLSAERPGFIEAEDQDDPDVLVFQMGILTGASYRIRPDGSIDA